MLFPQVAVELLVLASHGIDGKPAALDSGGPGQAVRSDGVCQQRGHSLGQHLPGAHQHRLAVRPGSSQSFGGLNEIAEALLLGVPADGGNQRPVRLEAQGLAFGRPVHLHSGKAGMVDGIVGHVRAALSCPKTKSGSRHNQDQSLTAEC